MENIKNSKPLIVSRTIPYLGGREIMVDKLIKFFAKNKGVCVVTPDKYPVFNNVSIYNANKDYEKILKWSKKQDIGVVNCHTFYLADLVIYLSKKLNKPLVFTLHGVFIDYYGKKYGSLLKKIYDNSDKIITVSDGYKKDLRNFLKKRTKIETIKNGIDLSMIDSLNKTKKFYRGKNKLSLSKFIVVVPARLNYIKGLEFLVRAINKIDDRDILFVVCSPKGRYNKKELVYKNKLKTILSDNSNNLLFKYLNNGEVFEYLKSSDIVLLPSLIEGISISLLEAMAFGKTVVATKVGGNTEIIKNGENGYLIRSQNVDDIIKIINKLKKKDLSKIEKGARKSIEKNFTSNIMFDKYQNLFKKIIYENK